jgi:pyruvate dehydrogenase E1 component alpha subunit
MPLKVAPLFASHIEFSRRPRRKEQEVAVGLVAEKRTEAGFLLGLYRKMLEIRLFELKAQELFRRGLLPGFIHLYVGEEAVAVGVCSTLQATDMIFSTHRGHGHALAKGIPARLILAELWGKSTGICGGRGGSMHLFAPEYGFMGTNGVVADPIPLATGAALSAKTRKTGQVVISFFGDGAVNSGSFHEALNFGAVWELPVVYVCENNMYATEMAFHRATKNTNVQSRAAAYKIPGVQVDGNDVVAVYEAASEAVDRARSGGGPTLIECNTYRTVGHHEGDPGTGYRTKAEVEEWKLRCPIKALRQKLLEAKTTTEETLRNTEEEVRRLIDEAVEFSRSSPQPSPETVLDYVF